MPTPPGTTSASSPPPHDVFISYSRKDADFARRLHTALAARGREVWIDWEDIPPTAEWWREITGAIDTAHAFIFVISEHSIASPVCAKELDYAVTARKRLIPLIRGASAPGPVPEALRPINWLFFPAELAADSVAKPGAGPVPFDSCLDGLLCAVDTDLNHVRRHTRLLVRARDWEAHARDPSYTLRGHDLRDAEAWLAASADKDPQPSALQRQYVLASRVATTRRQRFAMVAALASLVLVSVLAVLAFIKSQDAATQAGDARIKAQVAKEQTAEAVHQRNEAITQKTEAQKQATIALSRQLAAQSQELQNGEDNARTLSVLLAAEALRRFPVPEADNALRNAIRRVPHARFSYRGDELTAGPILSRTGRYLAVNTRSGVRLFDTTTSDPTPLITLAGHASDHAFSPGERLIITSGAQKLHIHEIATDRDFYTIDAQLPLLATFTADGERLLVVERAGLIRLFKTESGKPLQQSKTVLPGPLVFAAASHDARYVVLADRGSAAEVWDVPAGRLVISLFAVDQVAGVAINAQGNTVAVAGLGSTSIYSLPDGRRLYTLFYTGAPTIDNLALSPDGRWLTTSAGAGLFLRVIHLPSGEMLRKSPLHLSPDRLQFSASGARLLAANAEAITVWSFPDVVSIRRMTFDDEVHDAALSDDGSAVAFTDEHGLHVCSLADSDEDIVLRHPGVAQVRYTTEGRLLSAGDGALEQWDTATGRRLQSMTDQAIMGPFALDASHARVATLGPRGVSLRDLSAGGPARRLDFDPHQLPFEPMTDETAPPFAVAFSPDGLTVIAGRYRWNTESSTPLDPLPVNNVFSLAWSPDGSVIAVGRAPWGGIEAGLNLYEHPSLRPIATLGQPDNAVNDLAFSPDGHHLAAALDAVGAGVYSYPDCKEILSIPFPGLLTTAVTFSPDGRLLAAAASSEGAPASILRVVAFPSGAELVRIYQPGDTFDLAFSPDGRRLAAVGDDGLIRIFHITAEDLLAEAGQRIAYNFSRRQWTRYFHDEPYRLTFERLPIPPDSIEDPNASFQDDEAPDPDDSEEMEATDDPEAPDPRQR